LQTLTPEWWELFDRCADATPFQTPAWLLAWWQAFSPGRLQVICLRARQRLVGMAPFFVEENSVHESSVARRRVLPVGVALSDYLDVLLEPGFVDAGLALIGDYIRQTRPSWDEWEFAELPPAALAQRLSCPADCTDHSQVAQPCPVLQLKSAATLRGSVPKHQLQNLRTARRSLARLGQSRIEATPAGAIDERLEQMGNLLRARRREDGFHDPRVAYFHRCAAPELLQRNLLQIFSLMLDGHCAALLDLLEYRSRIYCYLTAFDRSYEHASPGTVLLGDVLERALQRGFSEFHFLRGGEAYKYLWGAKDRFNTRRVFGSNRAAAVFAMSVYERSAS
jgi:CelD/BcsL family acetyltransferase involved in cellulose biosynthesis